MKAKEEYAVLTYSPVFKPGIPYEWRIDVYSWPSEHYLAPEIERIGRYSSKSEAVLAGIAMFGKIWYADSEYHSVWNAMWISQYRDFASPERIAEAESGWRAFVSGLTEAKA